MNSYNAIFGMLIIKPYIALVRALILVQTALNKGNNYLKLTKCNNLYYYCNFPVDNKLQNFM